MCTFVCRLKSVQKEKQVNLKYKSNLHDKTNKNKKIW